VDEKETHLTGLLPNGTLIDDPQTEPLNDSLTSVERQILQLRSDLRAQFSAFGQLEGRLGKLEQELVRVRKELRLGDEETRRYMRVLHEDLVDRLVALWARLAEGLPPSRRRA
jgi:hypothetical protein